MPEWPYPHVSEAEFAKAMDCARNMTAAFCRRQAARLDRDRMLSEAYYRLARAAYRYDRAAGPWLPYATASIRGALLDEKICQTHPTGTRARYLQKDVKICSLDDFVGDESDTLGDHLVAEGPDPEACALQTVAAEEVWDLVRRTCSSPQVRVLELLFLEGLNQPEVADRIDRSHSRVHQIIAAARQRLRPVLSAMEGAP